MEKEIEFYIEVLCVAERDPMQRARDKLQDYITNDQKSPKLDWLLMKLVECYKRKRERIRLESAVQIVTIIMLIAAHNMDEMLVSSKELSDILLDIFSPSKFGNLIYNTYIFDIYGKFSDSISKMRVRRQENGEMLIHNRMILTATEAAIKSFLPNGINGGDDESLSGAPILCLHALFHTEFWKVCPNYLNKMVFDALLMDLIRKECEPRHLTFIRDLIEANLVEENQLVRLMKVGLTPVIELAVNTKNPILFTRMCIVIELLCGKFDLICKHQGKLRWLDLILKRIDLDPVKVLYVCRDQFAQTKNAILSVLTRTGFFQQ